MNKSRLKELLSPDFLRMTKNVPGSGNSLKGLYDLIQDWYKQDFTIVEIGSFEGSSTELFALHCLKVYAIDPYEKGNNFKQETIEELSKAKQVFKERIKHYLNVTFIQEPSNVAVRLFDDESLDAVYIDGDHRFNCVIEDIKLWLPKLKFNGVLSGHDYCENGGVRRAIDKLIQKPFKIYDDSSWAIKKTKDFKLKA